MSPSLSSQSNLNLTTVLPTAIHICLLHLKSHSQPGYPHNPFLSTLYLAHCYSSFNSAVTSSRKKALKLSGTRSAFLGIHTFDLDLFLLQYFSLCNLAFPRCKLHEGRERACYTHDCMPRNRYWPGMKNIIIIFFFIMSEC